MDLSGQTALVTGGAHRVGRELALALGRAGADVVVHYNAAESDAVLTVADLQALGVRAAAVQADLGNPKEASALIGEATAALAAPTFLINSAAIFVPGTLAETTVDDWDDHFALNLRAPFVLTQAFAQSRAGEPGKVVNIVDWRGARPDPKYLAYSLAKHGLIALTELAAMELAPAIQVNALALGAVLPPEGKGVEHLKKAAAKTPAGRPTSMEELSAALLFLLKNDIITGETLFLDGGAHLLGPRSPQ